ncbi:hypothetical protein ACA081_01310 [Candidatus Hodgkinia cicadicola]
MGHSGKIISPKITAFGISGSNHHRC